MKMDMKIRRPKRFQYTYELKAGLVIIAVALLTFLCIYFYISKPLPVVTLMTNNAEIRAGEELIRYSLQQILKEKRRF